MKAITAISLAALGTAGAWCALLRPRRNQPGWDKLEGVKYAHRGLHNADKGIPENSLAAFRLAVEGGFGAELDGHLMADGKLAVVHDSSLRRVCGREAVIEDLRSEDLPGYPLYDTQEHIPLLRDVLEVFEGGTPLVIELKSVKGNAAALTDAVMAELKGRFKPEFLNRLDEVILFDRLERRDLERIALRMLGGVRERLSGLGVDLDARWEAVTLLADPGAETEQGARPIRRAVRRRVEEPAADLAAVLSLASSFRDRPVPNDLAAIGEVGLTGELRAASALSQRLAEVKRLGFTKCMIPKRAQGKLAVPEGLELIRVANIREAMAALL